MSVANEKAGFQIAARDILPQGPYQPLIKDLVYNCHVFHLTITVPSRAEADSESAKRIKTSMQAWKLRINVEDALRALGRQQIEINPVCFEDFCEAITQLFPDERPKSLPAPPSVKPPPPFKRPNLYERMLGLLRG